MNLFESVEILKSNVSIPNLIILYSAFGVLLSVLFFFNILAFIYLNRYIRKHKHEQKELSFFNLLISRKDYLLLFILAVLFIAWKIIFLGKADIDVMESANIGFVLEAKKGNYSLILDYIIGSPHQPFYFVLVYLIQFMDNALYLLRLISVIFSTLTAFLVFCLCLEIFNNKLISYLGFILFNVHGVCSFYARRAEPYIIVCFFSLLSYYYFWTTFVSGRQKKIWKYWLVNAINFFIHYVSIIVICSQLLTILMLRWKERNMISTFRTAQFFRSIIAFNFIFILWVPFFYVQFFSDILFSNSWSNNFFLPRENMADVLIRISGLILGAPPVKLITGFSMLFMPVVILRIRKEKTIFYILIISIAVAVLFSLGYLMFHWLRYTDKFYLHLRYLLWLIPFVIMLYVYSVSIPQKEHLIKRWSIFFFCLIGLWNFWLTNKIIFGNMVPSYSEALRYIKSEYKEGDLITWPASEFNFCIPLNAKKFFHDSGNLIESSELLEKKLVYRRIWLVVAEEKYFSVQDINGKFIEDCVSFYKKNLSLQSTWKSNKISVMLFVTGSY